MNNSINNLSQPSLKPKGRLAFTLVELIVVITILAILWTIAFISLQWYSRDARDATRTSDVWNMQTTLELFNINAWEYPSPDNPSTISYSWDTVWYQWILWDGVTTNLKWLDKKPLDPLTKSEYTYSTTQSYKEYQILALYEWNVAYNPVINTANAATTSLTPKVVWNYNELFVQTNNYIVPTPSIITSEPWSIVLDWTTIKSQVITAWTNIPKTAVSNTKTWWLDVNLAVYTWSIQKSSTNQQKIKAIVSVQQAYNWTILANKSIYSNILDKSSSLKLINLLNNKLNLPNEKNIVYKTVANCWITWWQVLYWSKDWTFSSLICDNDIIICNWTTWSWYTISACNAWAIEVYTNQIFSSDVSPRTESINSWAWWVYQWWNNADISYAPINWTQIWDTTWYAPSTYSNPFFTLSLSDWTTIRNDNLWWNITNTNIARKWPCNIWYHVPTLTEWSTIYSIWWWSNWTDISLALKMPFAWRRNLYAQHMDKEDMNAYYWLSTVPGVPADMIYFYSNPANSSYDRDRGYGMSVRCIKN